MADEKQRLESPALGHGKEGGGREVPESNCVKTAMAYFATTTGPVYVSERPAVCIYSIHHASKIRHYIRYCDWVLPSLSCALEKSGNDMCESATYQLGDYLGTPRARETCLLLILCS